MTKNKKLIFHALILSSALALAACGDDEEVTQPVTDEAAEETAAPEAESTEDASQAAELKQLRMVKHTDSLICPLMSICLTKMMH